MDICRISLVLEMLSVMGILFVAVGFLGTLRVPLVQGVTDAKFEPVRILKYYDIETVLDKTGQERLKQATQDAVSIIERTLSVVRREDRLLLRRDLDEACYTRVAEGANKYKCSQVKGVYMTTGETCSGEFKIPDSHLEGLWVYNATSEGAVREVYPPGAGVEVDFILYIQAQPRANCVQEQALAYTKPCSRDPSGRPLAAFINVCPELVLSRYNQGRAKMTMLHELLHALGMSRDHFDSFRECHPSGCRLRSVVVEDIDGMPALVTPTLVQKARLHFNCPAHQKPYLGVPLQVLEGKYGSHWDERFMHSSIMVPTLGLGHLVTLDELTLSVFEDSGWYQVNYSMSDPFTWGKGAGCEFLQKKFCRTDKTFFCQSEGERMCDRGLQDKAVCSYIGDCSIPKSTYTDRCVEEGNRVTGEEEEVYSRKSRCFLSSLSTNSSSLGVTGRCYAVRCNQTDLVEVRVSNSSWMLCEPGASLLIPGYLGSVLCPPEGALCQEADAPPTTETPPTTVDHMLSTVSVYNGSEDSVLVVRMEFRNLDYHVISRPSAKYTFARSVVHAVVSCTDVDESRITGVNIRFGSVIFRFSVNPDPGKKVSTMDVYRRLENSLSTGRFVVQYNGMQLSPDVIRIEEADEPVNDDTNGTMIGITVFLSLLVLALLITATVLLLHRYEKLPTRKKPETESLPEKQEPSVWI